MALESSTKDHMSASVQSHPLYVHVDNLPATFLRIICTFSSQELVLRPTQRFSNFQFCLSSHLPSYVDQVFDMIQNEASCLERIQQLETELSAYKRAYADVDAEHRQCEKIKAECEKQKEILASQLQV